MRHEIVVLAGRVDLIPVVVTSLNAAGFLLILPES